jgi:hypothetical protein
MEEREIEAFIATGRQKHGEAAADGGKSTTPKTEAMRELSIGVENCLFDVRSGIGPVSA